MVVALAKLVVVVVGLAGCYSCLTGRCCTSSCHTHCLGHTIEMFHPGSVPAVSLPCYTPLFGNPLPSGPVDHICSILLFGFFPFPLLGIPFDFPLLPFSTPFG